MVSDAWDLGRRKSRDLIVGIIPEIGIEDVEVASCSPHKDYPFRHCAVLLQKPTSQYAFCWVGATGMPIPIHLVSGRFCSEGRTFISMKTFFSSQDFLFLTMLAQVYAEIFLEIETAVRASPVSPLSATAAHVGPILANSCE
jgi:hypothetical protein